MNKMKYLKKYNESVISKDVIKDICLELEDLGMRVQLYACSEKLSINPEDYDCISIHCYINKYPIEWENIKDTVLRLKNYLGDKFISFYYESGVRYIHVDNLDENTDINLIIGGFNIKYRNK